MGLLDRFTSSDEASTGQTPDKYRLLVTAGPSYDTTKHEIVPVNGGDAITVSNEFITAKVKVRVRGYRGLPSGSPASNTYFDDPVHEKDQYSLAFSFVPKQDIPSVDTVWGNDFDHPIRDRLPPGFNTAFKIVKEFIDPGLACDAYADEPWLYGPSLSCWFAFRIGDKVDGDDFPAPDDKTVLRDGADGSGEKVRKDLGIPDNNEKRRKFYLDAKNRKSLVFEKGRLYHADFYNPYLDFGNLALKLPGFSLKVYKYIDAKSHCLRYVFKNRQTGDMYLNVNFNLLWGQQLEDALAKEKSSKQEAPPETINRSEESRTTNGGDHPETEPAVESHEHADTVQPETQQPQSTSSEQTQPAKADPADKHIVVQEDNSRREQNKQSDGDKAHVASQGGMSQTTQKQSWRPAPVGAARSFQQQSKTDQVDDISEMLQNSSTDDKRGQETSILDVD